MKQFEHPQAARGICCPKCGCRHFHTTHDGSLADPAGVDVFQVKFFPTGIGDSQK